MKQKVYAPALMLLLFLCSCSNNLQHEDSSKSWQAQLDEKLPLLGHRNWILVVDKAFPLQTGEAIDVIYTGEPLLPVLTHVLNKIEAANHVSPTIFTDKELEYLDESLVEGIGSYKDSLTNIISSDTRSMLHDTVFTNIKQAAELFQIMVLKTDEVMPYTSIFIRLDCQYWPAEQEKLLRSKMNGQ